MQLHEKIKKNIEIKIPKYIFITQKKYDEITVELKVKGEKK